LIDIDTNYDYVSADAPVQNQRDTETEGSTCQLVVQPMDDIHIIVYLPALDFVLSYMTTRFDDNILPVVRQMMTFSGGNLLSKTVYQVMWTCFATDIILTLN